MTKIREIFFFRTQISVGQNDEKMNVTKMLKEEQEVFGKVFSTANRVSKYNPTWL